MKLIKIIISIIITSNFFLSIAKANNLYLYSFENIHIENKDINSYQAKQIGIEKTIDNHLNYLLNNLTINNENIDSLKIESNDYLKNIVIKNLFEA